MQLIYDVSVVSTIHTGTSPFESDEDVSHNVVSSGGYKLRSRKKRPLTEPTISLAKGFCNSSSSATEGHRGNGRWWWWWWWGNGGERSGGGGTSRGRSGCSHRSDHSHVPLSATSITVCHTKFREPPASFVPLRHPGPRLPREAQMCVSALSLFELYFDNAAMTRILDCTLAYPEDRKVTKRKRYNLFMRKTTSQLLS